MTKKLLLVTDAWHPQVNGVVTVFANLIPLLEARGYKVSLIEPSQFRTVSLPLYPEIRLALFPKKHIRTLLRTQQFDAVHIATEGPLGFAARAVCSKYKIPFTTSYHTHFQLHLEARVGSILTPLMYVFLRRFHAPASSTMVVSDSLKALLERHGFKHVVVWPLGVDTKLFVRNPSPSLPALTKPVFVYFGRLAPEKGIEEFLRLNLPGTQLVIGDGPSRRVLESKYPHAKFVGYKRGQTLVDWLSLCDVCIFPSRSETFGLVIVEALACGVPVAAHDVMGPRDIITNGKDGFLGEDLQEAALACLKLSPADCRAKALCYSWEASATIFLENLVPVRDLSK